MRTASLLSLVLFAGSGCVLQRAPILPEQDAGPRPDTGFDAGIDMRDVPPGFDGGVDTGIDVGEIDTGGIDTGMPDTGIDAGMPDTGVDAGMPDTGVDAPVRLTCDERYGTAAEYLACDAFSSAETCAFYTALDGATCSSVCTTRGGTCVAVYNNLDSEDGRCDSGGARNCDLGASDRICVCSWPP